MSILQDFVNSAPEGTERTLAALACAECLTDEVACDIYDIIFVPELTAEDFVPAFKYSGLTGPRNNGEWSLIPDVWEELQKSTAITVQERQSVHRYLLEFGLNPNKYPSTGSEMPAYLLTPAGMAYHSLCVGNIPECKKQYRVAKVSSFGGVDWLAKRLLRLGWNPYRKIRTPKVEA